MVFDFALVIDFEASCYGPGERPPEGWKVLVQNLDCENFLYHFMTFELSFASNNWSEITEFPAVLVNLSTEEIISEFHEFVRPKESPELSDFCKKLTHLEKKDLSKEKTLEEVMIDFELWTKDVQKEHDLYFYTPKAAKENIKSSKRIACICTWTDWDISSQLLSETKRKKIEIPEMLKSWVDLRAVSRVYLQSVNKKMGHIPVLRRLFRVLKMEWEGKHHSGIDDARNTARLAVKMAANLKVTRTLGVLGRIAGDPFRF